jgi:hypothetical protein
MITLAIRKERHEAPPTGGAANFSMRKIFH